MMGQPAELTMYVPQKAKLEAVLEEMVQEMMVHLKMVVCFEELLRMVVRSEELLRMVVHLRKVVHFEELPRMGTAALEGTAYLETAEEIELMSALMEDQQVVSGFAVHHYQLEENVVHQKQQMP